MMSEPMKQATAFAYGYSLAMLRSGHTEDRAIRVENLRQDMLDMGIMHPEGTVLPPYHLEVMKGKRKAEDFIDDKL